MQIVNALHTGYGWLITIILTIFTFIQPEMWSFVVVGCAIAADLFWGIAAAIRLKKFILSTALRETLKKIGIYSFALIGAFAIEKITHVDGSFFAVKTIAILAALCEFWSMSASMLIIKPNMPFLKIFRAQLKGEIESKVNKNLNIDDVFDEKQ